MKTITSLLALALFVGCQAESKRTPSRYAMTCEYIGEYLYRCENKEAVCYKYDYADSQGGLSCKWKEQR